MTTYLIWEKFLKTRYKYKSDLVVDVLGNIFYTILIGIPIDILTLPISIVSLILYLYFKKGE